MYQAMDPMAWHAAYSANLYRSYEATAAAHDGMWPPPQTHMNTFIPNNSDLVEPSASVGAASNNEFGSNSSAVVTSVTSAQRPVTSSPSEYKVFNNNESQDIKVRPSPDSGLAEAMSASGSPAGGHGQPHLQPQGSPIPCSNLVVRPQPARSPYEWMKRPANGIQSHKTKEGKTILMP